MNIAFISTEYITEADFDGGLANYLYRAARFLSETGNHVEIFTLSENSGEICHDGIRIHRVNNRSALFTVLNRITRYRFRRAIGFLSLSYCLNRRLNMRMREHEFDIIQASSCFACGLFSTFGRRIPVVNRISSFEPLFRMYYRRPLTLDQRLCERLELWAIKRSDAAYAPSRFLADLLRTQEGVAVDVLRPPFALHPGPEDETVYNRHLAGKPYFLFFGTVGFLKGCETIADALPSLLEKYPDMHFVFAGKVLDGPDGLNMQQYVSRRAGPHSARVIFTGSLRHHLLYPLIRNARAVVLPSLVDNFPNTMMEAMAFSKVVIGAHGTSFEEFIEPGVTGFLVPKDDPDKLAQVMEKVWNMNMETLSRIGRKAEKKVLALSPQHTGDALLSYFRRVMERRRD